METESSYKQKISSYRQPGRGKAFAGMILIIVGIFFLLDQVGDFLPNWIVSFPMFLIVMGLYLGSRQEFKKPGPFVVIAIGGFLLVDKIFPDINFSQIFWPLLIIGLGVYMILSKERKQRLRNNLRSTWNKRENVTDLEWDKKQPYGPEPLSGEPGFGQAESTTSSSYAPEDFIDSVSVFGGVKKNIMSKNFKGGDIVNFFGGAEINLIQADINGKVVLEVTQVFGGTKIIVPPHWEIHSEMAAIFGGIEDKRPIHPAGEGGKILVIRGTSIFGGIDIRSY
ncbi:MAG: hypothetical protein K0S09_2704 [Sphingobacteriaceae bacterium]|jgi:predicted membrane protein|nr:hypothetical protein [Sphingobacteriaceae bacterium]